MMPLSFYSFQDDSGVSSAEGYVVDTFNEEFPPTLFGKLLAEARRCRAEKFDAPGIAVAVGWPAAL